MSFFLDRIGINVLLFISISSFVFMGKQSSCDKSGRLFVNVFSGWNNSSAWTITQSHIVNISNMQHA